MSNISPEVKHDIEQCTWTVFSSLIPVIINYIGPIMDISAFDNAPIVQMAGFFAGGFNYFSTTEEFYVPWSVM